MAKQSDIYAEIYHIVQLIPRGKVSTYGLIAQKLGASPRLVGWALNASIKSSTQIPAHRVVNRNGQLTGKMHFETPKTMQERLQVEGVEVKEDTIIDFEKHLWIP